MQMDTMPPALKATPTRNPGTLRIHSYTLWERPESIECYIGKLEKHTQSVTDFRTSVSFEYHEEKTYFYSIHKILI